MSNIRLGELKAIDKHTVRITLKAPDADLAGNFVYYNTWIVPAGQTDYKHPVGTGAFKFDSFTPGQQSVFVANKNYWVDGQAVRRLAQGRLDHRQHRAPERAALGPDRRDGAAAHRAREGTRRRRAT